MASQTGISVEFYSSGYCTAHERIVDPVNGKGACKFYAVWALFQIPGTGWVMFDTGYGPSFWEVTQKFPARFYRWATPVFLKENESAKNILETKGISPADIKYIIISHFHADHIGGLNDFPEASFICSKSAHQQVKGKKGFGAVSKGILHGLLPEDYEKRLFYIEDFADHVEVNASGITGYRLFGQEELQLILLPGHARGMLGFILQNDQRHMLYGTDASWFYSCYHQGILPNHVVRIFFDSWNDFQITQMKIKAYENAHPEASILFTHCPETLKYLDHAV